MSIGQEHLSDNPNLQLAGLRAPLPSDDGLHTIEEVLSYRVEDGRVLLDCWTSGGEWATVAFAPVDEFVARMTLYPHGVAHAPRATTCLAADPPSPLIGNEQGDGPPLPCDVDDRDGVIRISFGQLCCEITKKPWEFTLKNRNWFPIMGEHRIDSSVRGGRRASWLGYRRAADGSVAATFDAFALAPDEHIYGLGEKSLPLDRRGQRIESWNVNTQGSTGERAYKNVPFLASSRGYGIFLNTSHLTTWDIGSGATSSVSTQVETEDDRLDLFFIAGPRIADILMRFTGLTGRPPVPPRWAFGYWQSKWGYRSWDDVWAVVNTAREKQVPLDGIHLDQFWQRNGLYADLVWDDERFPDPAGNLARLRAAGVRVSLWVQPWIPEQSEVFAEGAAHGAFATREDGNIYWYTPTVPIRPANRCGIVDFSSPAAREWYIGKLLGLIDQGVSAFVADYGEAIPEDAVFANGMRGREIHNQYATLYQSVFSEAFTRSGRANDLVCWGRAGWAGSQRHAIGWAGETLPSFPAMASALRGGLSMGLSGAAFWSHNIGGFMGTPSSELYTRWAQWGLLSGFSRAHGTTSREPWEQGEAKLTVFREYADLRSQLVPYLYSHAHEAHQTGLPLMRPLVLDYQDDPAVHGADTQYMLGPSLLVSPVLEDKAMSRPCYLPKGTWYNFWTDTVYEGGRWLMIPTTVETMPLYVKAGTVLPLGPVAQYTGDGAAEHGGPDELTLRVYLPRLPDPPRATGVLHENGGSTTFTYDDGTLTVEPGPGAPQSRTYTVIVAQYPPITATARIEGTGQITVS